MTLEGAINFNETTDYIIYTINSATTGQYGVVMPKNIGGTLNMLVDLHMKGSFDRVSSGTKTKEQLIEEISGEYAKLKEKYVDGMLVMPMIDEVSYQSAVTNNDKQKMFDEVKKIGAITSELYKKLTDSGIERQKIDQKIFIIEKNQEDENFVAWLKIQMPNFVEGILYNELVDKQEVLNPFMNNQDLFAQAVETPKVEEPATTIGTVSGGSIFDNVVPSVPVEPVVPTESVAPVESQPPVENIGNAISNGNVDIFGISNDVQGVNNTEVASNLNTNNSMENGLFENDTINSNSIAGTQKNDTIHSNTTVEDPKPVESAPLDGTTTFQPISNDTKVNQEVSGAKESNDGEVTDHASKGFANLLILVVVLVGVTIVSIELGKFLYSVYGA